MPPEDLLETIGCLIHAQRTGSHVVRENGDVRTCSCKPKKHHHHLVADEDLLELVETELAWEEVEDPWD